MYYCTSIYRSLSYPFRSFTIMYYYSNVKMYLYAETMTHHKIATGVLERTLKERAEERDGKKINKWEIDRLSNVASVACRQVQTGREGKHNGL